MTADELMETAKKTIADNPTAKIDSIEDRVLLRIPEPKKHDPYRVRLFGSSGPNATIINGSRGCLTVYVSSRKLLKYLTKELLGPEEES